MRAKEIPLGFQKEGNWILGELIYFFPPFFFSNTEDFSKDKSM
jgi:hypothetical protein